MVEEVAGIAAGPTATMSFNSRPAGHAKSASKASSAAPSSRYVWPCGATRSAGVCMLRNTWESVRAVGATGGGLGPRASPRLGIGEGGSARAGAAA